MHSNSITPTSSVLDYQSRVTKPAETTSGLVEPTLAIIAGVCPAVPIAGLMLRSGPIFGAGVLVSAVGILFGLIAFFTSLRRPGRAIGAALVTAMNGLVVGAVFWMFFVHGVC